MFRIDGTLKISNCHEVLGLPEWKISDVFRLDERGVKEMVSDSRQRTVTKFQKFELKASK